MFLTGSFAKNIDMLKKEMNVALLRREIISDNIANSDTPNFKSARLNFESQLKRALDSEKVKPFPALLSDKRHIPFLRPMDWRKVEPQKVWDWQTTSKANGNNVDIEYETMQLMENQLSYQTLVTVIQSEYSRVNMVLR